jgi:hypothetical protein
MVRFKADRARLALRAPPRHVHSSYVGRYRGWHKRDAGSHFFAHHGTHKKLMGCAFQGTQIHFSK